MIRSLLGAVLTSTSLYTADAMNPILAIKVKLKIGIRNTRISTLWLNHLFYKPQKCNSVLYSLYYFSRTLCPDLHMADTGIYAHIELFHQ